MDNWWFFGLLVFGFVIMPGAERIQIKDTCDAYGKIKLGKQMYECRKLEGHTP